MFDYKFVKCVSFLVVSQNFFMMLLCGDFYFRTYHLELSNKIKDLKNKILEMQEKNKNISDNKGKFSIECCIVPKVELSIKVCFS